MGSRSTAPPRHRRERFARWISRLALVVFALPLVAVLMPARIGRCGEAVLVSIAQAELQTLLGAARVAGARLRRRPTLDEVFRESDGALRDPWGSEWVMEPGHERTVFTFRSAGPDRCVPTADDLVVTNARGGPSQAK